MEKMTFEKTLEGSMHVWVLLQAFPELGRAGVLRKIAGEGPGVTTYRVLVSQRPRNKRYLFICSRIIYYIDCGLFRAGVHE